MKLTPLCLAFVLGAGLTSAWGADSAIGPDALIASGEFLTGSVGGPVSSDSIRIRVSMPGIGYETIHSADNDVVMTGGFLGQTESVAVSVVRPAILAFEQKGSDEYELTWRSIPGTTYLVEATDLLPALSWSSIASVTAEDDSVTATIPISGSARFFRIQQIR